MLHGKFNFRFTTSKIGKLTGTLAFILILVLTGGLLWAQSVKKGGDSTQANEAQYIKTAEVKSSTGIHETLRKYFVEGGITWMAPILLVFIVGLALVIERSLYLNLSSVNSSKLLSKVDSKLNEQGIDEALELCRKTRGPVASIFAQGLMRYTEGIDIVEKAMIAYGGVLMGRLERGLSWISLFIAIAPMLGFLGTVVGMFDAFDAIEAAGDISPTLVAGGIKVALLTTIFGLIVAMILQVLYSYLVAKIDAMVNDMEDSGISLVDLLVRYSRKNTLA